MNDTATFIYDRGDFVKDRVTGFEGLITGRTDCLNMCNRYTVQPKVGADGKMPDAYYVDEHALELIKKGDGTLLPQAKALEAAGKRGGGPNERVSR